MSAVDDAAQVALRALETEWREDYSALSVAEAIAAALAAAGLLPESRVHVEWGFREGSVETVIPSIGAGAEEMARRVVDVRPDHRVLMRREVTTYNDRVGDWTEVQP